MSILSPAVRCHLRCVRQDNFECKRQRIYNMNTLVVLYQLWQRFSLNSLS